MTDMYAEVLVGINIVSLPHNEATKWPVTLTDLEFTAARVGEFFDSPYYEFGRVRHYRPRSTAQS